MEDDILLRLLAAWIWATAIGVALALMLHINPAPVVPGFKDKNATPWTILLVCR